MLCNAIRRVVTRQFCTSSMIPSVYNDSHLDALDRRKRSSSHRSKEFDTLGTWDTRLNVELDEKSMLKTGHVVPNIEVSMVGVATNVGRRTYQEDRYCVKQLRPNLLYLAVFDGHGGTLCADYCQDYFDRHIIHHLDSEEDLLKVLDKAFHDINHSFERWYRSKREHLGRSHSSGSTATVCLIQDNYQLYIGHCGDSRAILCREGKVRRLTKDHCPSDPKEAKRIADKGGRVIHDSIGRSMVNNRLAMSRSIGDLEMKKFGVSSRPDLIQKTIKHGKDQFLVLTSDGINFVMQDKEVLECINRCDCSKEGAARLVDQALLYSCEDNATAIVVPFGSWGKGDPSSSMFYSFGRNMTNSSRFN